MTQMRQRCIFQKRQPLPISRNISPRLEKLLSQRSLIFDQEDGFPVMMAAAESRRRHLPDRSPTDIVTPDATSGPAEWGRYHDAVREAARSFDDPEEGDIH